MLGNNCEWEYTKVKPAWVRSLLLKRLALPNTETKCSSTLIVISSVQYYKNLFTN